MVFFKKTHMECVRLRGSKFGGTSIGKTKHIGQDLPRNVSYPL
jgi:hypothetical protein